MQRAHAVAHEAGKAYVKTQGPSARYEPYERARAFYEGVGFKGLEEFAEIWGTDPCLIMITPVTGAD